MSDSCGIAPMPLYGALQRYKIPMEWHCRHVDRIIIGRRERCRCQRSTAASDTILEPLQGLEGRHRCGLQAFSDHHGVT